MMFQFEALPLELALEILRFAASPGKEFTSRSPYRIYETARTLALVSHSVRHVIMPYFLRTVIITNQESLNLFFRTLHQQEQLSRSSSRLSLTYPQLVKRVWSSGCWEPISQQQSCESSDLLSKVFYNSTSIGLTFSSQHLLYDSLANVCPPNSRKWGCKRLTFAGHNPRWNPFTSTAQGQAFLHQLTHLTIWLPSDDSLGSATSSPVSSPADVNLDLGARIPNWIKRIPFESMPNLSYFAFTLTRTPRSTSTQLVMYILGKSTRAPSVQHDEEQRTQVTSTVFREWATSAEPLSHGKLIDIGVTLVPFENEQEEEKRWSLAFLKDDMDI